LQSCPHAADTGQQRATVSRGRCTPQSADLLTSEILSYLAAAIRAAFPGAAWLETRGQYSKEQDQQLRALRIFSTAGTLIADAENPATTADHAFAALAETLSHRLNQHAHLDGTDYLGAGRIDLT
jgi:hypothetical protein